MNSAPLLTRLAVVLKHWIEHNQGHREEYAKWAEVSRSEGLAAVGEQIDAAAGKVLEADAMLRKALQELEKSQQYV